MIPDDAEYIDSFLVPKHDLSEGFRLGGILGVSDFRLLRIVALFISTIQFESLSEHASTHLLIRLFFELL